MAEIRELSMELINKANEKYESVNHVIIQVEINGQFQPARVGIYKEFSTVGIKQCIAELIDKLDMAKARDRVGFVDAIMPFMMFMMIKHFTTLNMPVVFAEQLKAIDHMINTGTLFQIFMNFDEEQVKRVQEELQFVLDSFESKSDEIEKLKVEIKDKLVNKDLLE